jgi:tetratricopeptide (TPR) repeat protein
MAGLAALRAGKPADAVAPLLEVADDRELAAAEDLADVRARALSLCAQALLLAGRPGEALPRAEAALALARRIGDPEGTADVEQLVGQIRAARPSAAPPNPLRHAPSASVDEIEARVRDPGARAELLLRSATAELDAGRLDEGAVRATRALDAAPDLPRIGVLARLALARARPDEAAALLREAAEVARDAHEPTLLGLVSRAAELASVDLGALHGPDTVKGGSS